jgi:hypothetical protein
MRDEDSSDRIRQEVQQEAEDPVRREGVEHAGEASLIGRMDRIAEHEARRATGDSREHGGGEALDIDTQIPAVPETGEGDTIELTADTERQLRPGEELAIRLPVSAGEGWTYEIDGDFRALDVYERAEVVSGGRHLAAPGASGGVQFLVRAERKGKATVRFERLDRTADDRPMRLKIKVK